jgi:hypothetical protein
MKQRIFFIFTVFTSLIHHLSAGSPIAYTFTDGKNVTISYNQEKLNGNVYVDRYYAPDDLFSVKIPDQHKWNQTILDHSDEKVCYVLFLNSIKKNVRVEFYPIEQEDSLSARFASILSNRKEFKTTRQTMEEKDFLDENLGQLHFSLIKKTNQLKDTTLVGYLYCRMNNHLVLVTVQLPPNAKESVKKSDQTQLSTPQLLLKQSLQIMKSIEV